ncbi:hypothetical protein BB934_45745 (plasmid) [Microvirga ossetica]|uniref:Uncharacterized protein n=1 Tax=Microvirga ossetica TaxID=1882682 RepID=A0A1B2EZV5_9HYPH|nr:hypothetical protein [Microvirga ossetica]ANY85525.1 hypothetical protein BB934_45745 [Microvirga ossetica]
MKILKWLAKAAVNVMRKARNSLARAFGTPRRGGGGTGLVGLHGAGGGGGAAEPVAEAVTEEVAEEVTEVMENGDELDMTPDQRVEAGLEAQDVQDYINATSPADREAAGKRLKGSTKYWADDLTAHECEIIRRAEKDVLNQHLRGGEAIEGLRTVEEMAHGVDPALASEMAEGAAPAKPEVDDSYLSLIQEPVRPEPDVVAAAEDPTVDGSYLTLVGADPKTAPAAAPEPAPEVKPEAVAAEAPAPRTGGKLNLKGLNATGKEPDFGDAPEPDAPKADTLEGKPKRASRTKAPEATAPEAGQDPFEAKRGSRGGRKEPTARMTA